MLSKKQIYKKIQNTLIDCQEIMIVIHKLKTTAYSTRPTITC